MNAPHNGTENSRIAADSIAPHMTRQEHMVYEFIEILSAGRRGKKSGITLRV